MFIVKHFKAFRLNHAGYRQLVWPRENILLLLRSSADGDVIDRLEIDANGNVVVEPVPCPLNVMRLYHHCTTDAVLIETTSGHVYRGTLPFA
jgi:hypothetical protein